MSKTIKLIKNRSDLGAGTRGADMGIDAIEVAAINNKNDYFTQYESIDLETENESIYNKVNNSFGKRIKQVYRQCVRLSDGVHSSINENKFPLVISGDHSSALGSISGIKAANPDKRLGVVWIDAHADIHSPFTSPSGNIHGMPLAAALSEDNIACKINDISEDTAKYWSSMKNIGCEGAKVLASDVVYFGVRDTEEPEEKQIEELGIKNYLVHEVRYRGLEVCVNETLESLSDCDMIYISFDVDSMDCDLISYGTGTPVPKGFDQYEIISIINQLIASKKVSCLELVEVNPLLDLKGNKMAETAFEVLNAVTKTIKENI
jgi:arginase|tara:strand:+ start:104 stop:1063 length:960 start_codon:yes stop_codon:yes gene_type:complete